MSRFSDDPYIGEPRTSPVPELRHGQTSDGSWTWRLATDDDVALQSIRGGCKERVTRSKRAQGWDFVVAR